jgi:hypothetical protein
MSKYQKAPDDVMLTCVDCGETKWFTDPRSGDSKLSKVWNKAFRRVFDLISVEEDKQDYVIDKRCVIGKMRKIKIKAHPGKFRCYKCKYGKH